MTKRYIALGIQVRRQGAMSCWGHILHEEIASGAFGKVYRASDSNGNNVAVKVLHEEMRQSEDLFHAFPQRRTVYEDTKR